MRGVKRVNHGNNLETARLAYVASMSLMRVRLLACEAASPPLPILLEAERLALHVRKIVEGLAFSALSACEIRSAHLLREQRTKDPDKLLTWLHARGMLRLPQAQRELPSQSLGYAFVLEGAGHHDLGLTFLKSAYIRASALLHERHPERLGRSAIETEAASLREDACMLRSWLWTHIMFLKGGDAVCIRMDHFGADAFCVGLTRSGDIPSER